MCFYFIKFQSPLCPTCLASAKDRSGIPRELGEVAMRPTDGKKIKMMNI